jgi:hypothetical protein
MLYVEVQLSLLYVKPFHPSSQMLAVSRLSKAGKSLSISRWVNLKVKALTLFKHILAMLAV